MPKRWTERHLRFTYGLYPGTVAQLAKAAGLSVSHLYALCKGETRNPMTEENADRLARAFRLAVPSTLARAALREETIGVDPFDPLSWKTGWKKVQRSVREEATS